VIEPFQSRGQALAWARDLVRRSDVLYLDTETTGVRFGFDDVIDIGIVDGRGIVVMDQLIRPSVAIPGDSEAVHGISNRAVSNAPRLPEVWSELSRILNGHVVVSYNATFDEQMLSDAGARRGLSPIAPAKWDCAMEAFAAYNGELSHHRPGFRWINLGAAARLLGLEAPKHRAISDAMLCLELVQELSRRK
jgi:DNA polymerase III subunit epsilon